MIDPPKVDHLRDVVLRRLAIVALVAATVASPLPATATPAPQASAARREATLTRSLAAARLQRLVVLREAHSLAPHAAAVHLAEAALALDDPPLAIEAAAVYLDLRSEHGVEQARRLTESAREQLAALPDPHTDRAVDVRRVRLTRDEAHAWAARGTILSDRAAALHQQFRDRHRRFERARHELRAGVVSTTVGVAGLGVLAGGLALRGHNFDAGAHDLDAPRDRRANAMLAVGATTAALGLLTGAVLIGLGLRDPSETTPHRRARLRVAPSIAGLHIVGRF